MNRLLLGAALAALTSLFVESCWAGTGTASLSTSYPSHPITTATAPLSTYYSSNAPATASATLSTSYPAESHTATSSLSTSYPARGSGGTIACDYGPPYVGDIPAGAVAAGFTHCAVNLDFSQFANLSDFIDCFGATNPLLYEPGGGLSTPCDSAHYAMVTDQGIHVLAATWYPSDGSLTTQLNSDTLPSPPAYTGFTLPIGQFVEHVWRLSSVDICSSNCLLFGAFEYPPPGDPGENFTEIDWNEIYTGPGGTNHNMGTNMIGSVTYDPADYDPTNYHTYGMRVTTDGNGNFAFCNYYSSTVVNGLPSGTLNGCGTSSHPSANLARMPIIDPWLVNTPDIPNFTSPLTAYLARTTIWECPGWNDDHSNVYQSTTQCNGSLLTGAP